MSVRKRRTCSVLVAALPVLLLGARAGGAEERGGRVEKVVLAIHGGAGDLPKDKTSPELARRREGIERARGRVRRKPHADESIVVHC